MSYLLKSYRDSKIEANRSLAAIVAATLASRISCPCGQHPYWGARGGLYRPIDVHAHHVFACEDAQVAQRWCVVCMVHLVAKFGKNC